MDNKAGNISGPFGSKASRIEDIINTHQYQKTKPNAKWNKRYQATHYINQKK